MYNEHVGSMSAEVVDWVGSVDPSEYALYVDNGLLLIFGGIPWQVSQNYPEEQCANEPKNFYRCTVQSDIHTVHSPTDAHLLEL